MKTRSQRKSEKRSITAENRHRAPYSLCKADALAGTDLVGFVSASYDQILAAFGRPNSVGDGIRINKNWCIRFEDGTVASLYDWKFRETYPKLRRIEQIREVRITWNIGGFTPKAVDRIADILKVTPEYFDPNNY